MAERRGDPTDILAGAIFLGLGLAFGAASWFGLTIGTALRMGPGYAPLMLAGGLVVIGALILIGGLRAAGPSGEAPSPLGLRGFVLILGAPILFGLTVRGLGLVPAIFLATLTAAFATPRVTPARALILAAAVTIFATVVFSYALGLPFRRFGPWLEF